jgi:uncharacterized membrane protein YedE/YeeE
MKNLIGLVAGLFFGIGLVVSGMTNPSKVIGFLDIFGEWDYSLAFVMGGAVLVNLILFKLILNRKPILEDSHSLPSKFKIDKRLISGAALFGIGWGLVGICPGPGIVNLVTLNFNAIIFIISMIVGMAIFKGVFKS